MNNVKAHSCIWMKLLHSLAMVTLGKSEFLKVFANVCVEEKNVNKI